jgi:hypothetical protein
MRQVPGGRWGVTWLVVGIVMLAAVIELERFVRERGFQPSVKEDAYSWAWERMRAADGSPRTIAILGSSRILLAFSSQTFREILPGWRSVQLAIEGTSGIGSLRHLATDPEFRGIAIVDVSEFAFDPSGWDDQDDELHAYDRRWRSIGAMADRWLTTRVQSQVALLSSGGLRTLDAVFRHGEWPRPRYLTTHADRTKFADYALTDAESKRAAQLARIDGWDKTPAEPAPWLAHALANELYIALIQARGGNVVYVRMPTCDERWINDENKAPKAVFWDRLARHTRATAIHFKDDPTLSDLACPDTSHIASKDGPRFTRALLEILVARGVVRPPF